VVTSLTAMYVEASIAAYVAFVIPLVVAPYTIHQRRQINKLPALMEEIKKCQNQVARLAAENVTLHTNINNLTAQVQKLAEVDDQLAAAAKSHNEDITTLRMLIYTHGSIQRQMKQYVHAQDLQQLLKTLLACETDKNFVIQNSELDQLLLRLEILGSRIPKDVLKEALQNATMKQQSTTNLYRTLLDLDVSQCGGDCYVQYNDFEEHKMT
jgi:cell division protein FtsB